MRVVFMGTPRFAATVLENVAQQHDVVAVYTRPDAVRGRGKRLEACPVKLAAERCGLPVFDPVTLRDDEVQRDLVALQPDVICVAAYGAILPKAVLDIPRYGCLNVHASLLPRWRGAAPVERAILAGDEQAGVCIMRMEEGLDTGAYCICRSMPIADKNASELSDALADLGSQALLTALVHVERGGVEWTEQNDANASYASKVEKGELCLSLADTAEIAARKVRASSAPHPSRAVAAGRGVTVLEASEPRDEQGLAFASGMRAGEVRFVGKRLFFGMAVGALEVKSLKPDGKQAMDARSFAAGVQGIKNGNVIWEEYHVR